MTRPKFNVDWWMNAAAYSIFVGGLVVAILRLLGYRIL